MGGSQLVSSKYGTINLSDCIAVGCGPPSNPDNGQVATPFGTALNDVAAYSCDEGYSLTGSATQTCGSNGMWTPTAPACDGNFNRLCVATHC